VYYLTFAFMAANTVTAVIMVMHSLGKSNELNTLLSGFAGLIQRIGSGAFVWQYCAFIESVVYLWIPLQSATVLYWSAIGAACLLIYGVAWGLTQRTFPASKRQSALNGMLGVTLAMGTLQELGTLRKAAPASWTPWLLLLTSA
jgi:hypothetical protein